MLLVLTLLSILACSQAKPNVTPEETLVLDAADEEEIPEYDVCPPGYTFFPNIREWLFTRDAKATRIKMPLDRYETLQCVNSSQCDDFSSTPGTVECLIKAAENGFYWSCSAPNNSAISIVDPIVLCEVSDSISPCILNDSCVLRYRIRGSNTWTIVGIVAGVTSAVGLTGAIIVFTLFVRRRG